MNTSRNKSLTLCVFFLMPACSGGGSNSSVGGGTVVTPTPTPTAVVSPTPTPAPSTGNLKPGTNAESSASVQLLTVNAASNATSDRAVTAPPSEFGITFNATSQTYTLQNEQRSRQFGPAQFITETGPPDLFPRVEYESRASGEADFLVIFKAPNASPALPFSRAAYGAWQHNMPQGADTRVRLDYFAYGTPTPVSAMPHSGTATYRFAGTGNYADNNQLFFATTSGTIRVDFAAGTFTTNVSLTGSNFFGSNFGGVVGFTATGLIIGNAVTGTSAFTAATWTGSYKLAFFGPNAEEVALVFTGVGLNGSLNGAAIGITP